MTVRHGSTRLLLRAWLIAAGMCMGADTAVIDSFDYADDAAAGKVWTTPMPGLPPVALAGRGGGQALCLPCPFSRDLPRSLYHRDTAIDLGRAARIEFDLCVDKPEAIGQFTIYFISGNGCYRGSADAGDTGWRRVRMNKASFETEGTPGGWDSITGVRFSPWKAAAVDAVCTVDNLEAKSGGDIAIVIGAYAARKIPTEARAVRDCAGRVAALLDGAGVMARIIEDEDIAHGALDGIKVAILPYNPRLSEPAAEGLKRFAKGGGKLIAFYDLPDPLPELLGIRMVKWLARERDGQFLEVDFSLSGVPGMPRRIRQDSGAIFEVEPIAKHARVIGQWIAADGRRQKPPAVVLSDAGAFMAHTLLPGDTMRQRQFLVALAGSFCASAWAEAAEGAIERAGEVGPFSDAGALASYIRGRAPGHPLADGMQAGVARGEQRLGESKAHCAARRWPEAAAAAEAAREHFAEAYLAAQRPVNGEWRAVSNHTGTGGEPGGWEESARVLAECGFNAVLPDMAWGGVAHYNSAVLPKSEAFRKRGDQLAQCVAACHKRGIQVHAWKLCWNLEWATPREFVERMRAEGRLQVTDTGETREWLCPSHPANFKLETDSMLEMVRNYDVDGLMFDAIRYADSHGCFCSGCRERFQHDTAQKAAAWPADVVLGPLRRAYLDWRCEQITRLVRAVSRGAHAIKPHVRISAAVFHNYPVCRDDVGQDWVAWIKEGLLDFVIPMNTATSGGTVRNMVKGQIALIDARIPVCPSLFVTLESRVLTPDQAAAQIAGAREAGADGFTLFDHSPGMPAQYLRRLAGRVIGGNLPPATDAPVFEFDWPDPDPRLVTVSPAKARPMRKPVSSVSGRLELQDMEGRAVAQLGPAPAAGHSQRLRLTASPGSYRVAVVGQVRFKDESTAPFVFRSRVVALDAGR